MSQKYILLKGKVAAELPRKRLLCCLTRQVGQPANAVQSRSVARPSPKEDKRMKFASPTLFLFTGLVIGWIFTADHYQREYGKRCRMCALLEGGMHGPSQNTFQTSVPVSKRA